MKKLLNVHFNVTSQAAVFVISLFILHSSFFTLHSQNVAINATGNQADPSAMLDVSSQTAGVLIPRMSTATRNAISSPATGLQVFNTDCNELNFWNGVCWISMGSIPEPHPITSSSATSLCAAVSATYSITAVTGATGYDWTVPAGATINSGQGTTSVSVTWGNYSGDICVDAYDACESSDQRCLDINVNPIPPTPGNITGLASVSPGQTNVSYFIASVSGASSYTWTVPTGATIVTGTGTPVITVNFACNAVSGNVTVTAGSNCGTSTASGQAITVTSYLSANAGSAVFGGAVIGGSPAASGGFAPYTYSWSPNSNLSSATVANPTALCSGSTTTYTLNVTDAGGCTATSSVVVTRNLTASAGSAIFGGAALSGSATGGVSPYAYSWSPNSNLSSYTVANPTALCSGSTTTYSLTVTDANGCASTSNVAVTRNLTASAGTNNTICNGTSAAIGGSPTASGGVSPYTYSWSPNTNLTSSTAANPTANPASTTTYTINITDAHGCTATSSMTLTITPLPASSFTPTTAYSSIAVTFTPTVTGATYSWTFASGSPATSTSQNPSVTWSNTGSYNVSLTVTQNGCSSTTTNTITVNSPPKNCEAILLANSSATSGVYTVYPSTGSMSCYCDMTTDGGGWTLVYRDSHDGTMSQSTGSVGTLSNLQSVSGSSAKYADNVINALISNPSSTAIGYRTNSTSISNEYFHPSNCVYSSGTSNPNPCMQVITPYTPSASPSYTQFVAWGGGGGGINCWYGSNSQYDNVVCTSKSYTEIGSITTNSSYGVLGSSNTAYGNVLLMWVK